MLSLGLYPSLTGRETLLRDVLGPILLIVVSVLWFARLSHGVIAYDDVGAVLRWEDPSVGLADRTVLDVTFNRWRPVFTVILTVAVWMFGESYTAYFWFNVALTTVVVLLVHAFALRLSSSRVVALATALVVLTARFSYYQVTQVIGGPLEAVCLILLLLLLHALWSFEQSGRRAYLALSLSYFALLMHTHERYVVLAAVLVAVILTSTRLTRTSRLWWAAACALPVVLSIAVRSTVLHIPLLVGTTSDSSLGFTPRTALVYYAESVFQTIGLNIGPADLNGLTFSDLSIPWQVASVVVAGIVIMVVIEAFGRPVSGAQGWRGGLGHRRPLLAGTVLILVLILSFSITVQVEPRWFYAPFVVLMLMWAYSLSLSNRSRREHVTATVSLLVVLVLSVGLNLQYRSAADRVYFMSARAAAADIVAKTVGKYGTLLSSHHIYVVEPVVTANWATFLPDLLAANSAVGSLDVTAVTSLEDVPADPEALVFEVTPTGGFDEIAVPRTR